MKEEAGSSGISVVGEHAFACKLWETLPLPQILGLPKPEKETADFLCLYLWVWADGMFAWALISAACDAFAPSAPPSWVGLRYDGPSGINMIPNWHGWSKQGSQKNACMLTH